MSKTSRMGRPRYSDSERQEKVQAIISAAQTLFATEGYQAVSMRKISDKAGMGTMTLYKYFPSKTAILHHVWGVFFDELFAQLKTEIAGAGGAKAKIRQACVCYVRYWVEHKDRFRIVFLNEDRADSSDDFFINHANILGEFLQIAGPLINDVVSPGDHGKMMVLLESAICYVHGIALNVITISEYPWHHYEKYIDVYLDAVLP
jgi:AcrR family transcriptional regulator